MSSATAVQWPEQTGGFSRLRLKFRTWRRTRPFWGGLLSMMAGAPIMYFPYAKLHMGGLTMTMATTAGAGSLIIGILLVTLGLTTWFQPLVRIFCGVAVTILALISVPVSNLGGFGMGLILGLLGGGLVCAWAPLKVQPGAEGVAEMAAQAPEAAYSPEAAEEAAVEPQAHVQPEAVDPGEQR